MASKRKTDSEKSDSTEKRATISVTLTVEQSAYLQRLKEQQGVNSSWLIRQLLDEHMKPRRKD